MKNITVKSLTNCGIKSTEIAKVCKVTQAAVCKWNSNGTVPMQYRKKIKTLVASRQKKISMLVKRFN